MLSLQVISCGVKIQWGCYQNNKVPCWGQEHCVTKKPGKIISDGDGDCLLALKSQPHPSHGCFHSQQFPAARGGTACELCSVNSGSWHVMLGLSFRPICSIKTRFSKSVLHNIIKYAHYCFILDTSIYHQSKPLSFSRGESVTGLSCV